VPYFVVERYWPGVTGADVTALAGRLRSALQEGRGGVRYLGSVLLVGDDVVQCRFEAPDVESVHRANDAAGARIDRILEAVAYAP
jgi:hypothetical protein